MIDNTQSCGGIFGILFENVPDENSNMVERMIPLERRPVFFDPPFDGLKIELAHFDRVIIPENATVH